jgi:hypothetical protein
MSAADLPLPPTATRVERSTSDEINARIERETAANVAHVASRGPAAIARRLEELDREWDIERTLEANAATIILVALGLGFSVNRRWFALPAVVATFLLQHALQGWCPPVPIFRRRGIRTEREINLERTALRILRGDFESTTTDPHEAVRMAKGNGASLL